MQKRSFVAAAGAFAAADCSNAVLSPGAQAAGCALSETWLYEWTPPPLAERRV
jgi:hypothetical protein